MFPWSGLKKKEQDDGQVSASYPIFILKDDGTLEESKRIDWDNYFMMIAEQVSTRGTCDRKQVGCILVKDRRILSTGYNGSISGSPHCDDVGHMMDEGHCVRTVHAEINALAQCAKYGTACDGATAYINTCPCWGCFKALINAGIKAIYYRDPYKPHLKEKVFETAKDLRIPLIQI